MNLKMIGKIEIRKDHQVEQEHLKLVKIEQNKYNNHLKFKLDLKIQKYGRIFKEIRN